MSIGRIKLSAYIAYLQQQQARFPSDPEICWVEWMVRPEVFALANGEISISEERSVTADDANGVVAAKA